MYLDPGFGSMLIQVLIASLAAAGAMFAMFRGKIMAFFKKSKKNAKTGDKSDDNE